MTGSPYRGSPEGDSVILCGGDEAGRGAVVGPLVVALVSIKKSSEHKLSKIGVRDSKLLSRKRREPLYREIRKMAESIKVGKIMPEEINQAMANNISLNELEAIHFARLLDKMDSNINSVYVDSPDVIEERFGIRINMLSSTPMRIKGVKQKGVKAGVKRIKLVSEHKADSRYPIVSAASIVAKVVRDREMRKISRNLKIELGSGYPSDYKTIDAIRRNLRNKEMYAHIRSRWSTMERIRQTELTTFLNE